MNDRTRKYKSDLVFQKLTLTDIATGWTECVPVLNRSPETVLAATIDHAIGLFLQGEHTHD